MKAPWTGIAALLLGAVVVAGCYACVDRPVARFFAAHDLAGEDWREWPDLLSHGLTVLAGLGIAGVVLWRMVRRGGRLQTVLMAVSTSLVVTTLLKLLLKWGFGRSSPREWLSCGDYGFYPFRIAPHHASFPSGHAAVVFAVLPILWIACPRWRWLWAILAAGVCAALVGLNYHFVGDVIAGIMLGSAIGGFVVRGFRLGSPLPPGEG